MVQVLGRYPMALYDQELDELRGRVRLVRNIFHTTPFAGLMAFDLEAEPGGEGCVTQD
jgi:hypothetical protein